MSGLEMRYFILKPKGDSDHAVASRCAMAAYATSIERCNPQLANELLDWVRREVNAAYGIPGPGGPEE